MKSSSTSSCWSSWSSSRFIAVCIGSICLLLTALLYVIASSPIQSAISKVMQAEPGSRFITPNTRRLKVYMYDLPRKFNFGLFDREGPDQELPWRNLTSFPAPHRTGLRKQHSVEYWLTLDLITSSSNSPSFRVAERVSDPGEAHVFFVPFFSSLSFNVYGVSMRDPETEHDKNLQKEVMDFLKKSIWWQRSGGRDHILMSHHPNAFRFVRDRMNTSLLIVSDFGRLPRRVASLNKDVVAPYSHMIPSFEDDCSDHPFDDRTTLLFFQGRVKRKDDGVVRSQLAEILENQPRVHFEEGLATNHTVDQAMQGMRSSRFCLHPAGDTPSSCRLFDAIVSHCVPVIISDKIELPFEDELDYTEFSLFFSVEEAIRPGFLIRTLTNFPEKRWLKMWRKLKLVSRHFEYQHPSRKDDAVNMLWKQVLKKVPSIQLAIHRDKRLKIPDWWKCKRR